MDSISITPGGNSSYGFAGSASWNAAAAYNLKMQTWAANTNTAIIVKNLT